MSKIAKWNLEKTKVKVVFRLQFHATHIPPSGWDKLFISLFPTDSGKATAKTTKANVRNGTCKWGDPIYETTRFLQDGKSKLYDDKVYKLVVSMGSSRSSILGEASINLAEYADAFKPSTVALPLHGCNSGTVLHVTVQLLTSKTGFREFEQQRELRERGFQTGSDVNRQDVSGTGKMPRSEEAVNSHIDKVSSRVKFRSESKDTTSLDEEGGLNVEYSDSAVGFDGSSNTSESLYAEKHDTSSTHEIDSLKSTVSGDLNGTSHCQSPQAEKGDPSYQRTLLQGSSDWIHGWNSDYSVDNDLAIVYEENSRLRGSLEVAESAISELKLEVHTIQNHADEIGIETQKFTQQLASEIASGEALSKEIAELKSECANYKEDLERLKDIKLNPQVASRGVSDSNLNLSQDVQLKWLCGLQMMEDKIRKLQNKVYIGFHERDFSFLDSELESLFGVLQGLKEGTGGTISLQDVVLSEKKYMNRIMKLSSTESEQFVSGDGFDVDLYQPEGMLQYLSIPLPVPMSQEPEPKDDTHAIQGKIFELLRELDESKTEKESLVKKMDQMECYYEALVQELEENQKQILGELQNLRNEHANSLSTIATNKVEMEAMHHDINEQISRFSEERRDLDSINKELERRVITSEAALKRARLNYSIAVGQLQKDLDLLSLQVLSMYETNENLIKQSFSESSQPCFQGHADTKQNQEESDAAEFSLDQNRNARARKQNLGGDILLEDLKRSLHFQEELYQKVEEELCEMHLVNVQLDVFSKILQETLLQESYDIIYMKEKIDKLGLQLKFSTESQQLLMLRLQEAMEEIHTLNEDKVGCIAKCNDMVLQNQSLESKLERISCEHSLLTQKIAEWEKLMMEYQIYEHKYKACSTEKMELVDLLKKETLEKGNLHYEISTLKEEFGNFRAEYDDMASLKDNLEKTVNFVQDKIGTMLFSYEKLSNRLFLCSNPLGEDLKFNDVNGAILQLVEIQNNTFEKILLLIEEKKELDEEIDVARVSMSTAESEMLVVKQKFKNDTREMLAKLEMTNALVEKFQFDLEAIVSKLNVSSEAEEKYAQQNKELCSGLACLEHELQRLTSENRDLAREILGLDAITDELSKSKLTITELTHDKQELIATLDAKAEESVKLACEFDGLKENLRFLHDELHAERSFKIKLENTITDLNNQLEEKHGQLFHFSQQNAELQHFQQLAIDLESEKSRVSHLLLQREEFLEKLQAESSRTGDLDIQLFEMHKYLLAAEVELTFTRSQYKTQIQELGLQHRSSERVLGELHQKYLDIEVMLSHSLASESHYIEENVKLIATVESMKAELEAFVAQRTDFSDSNSAMVVQLEEYKKREAVLKLSCSQDKNQQAMEVGQLKNMLFKSEEEIDNLMASKEELEIRVIVFKAKLDEQEALITSLEEHNEELTMLRNQSNDLSSRLSEQILKTEEFKSLSIHLKELKDKADAECLQARGRREPEGPSVAVQESLRIAFIKEQYETKLQEMKHQHSISKKHGEEMLLKFQDAIDEIEIRKKSEASNLKRIEELSIKILELEAELQSFVSEKHEKLKAYDQIKAELDCTLLSLECCKEEKEKLEASLQDCDEEKSRIAVELNLTKELLRNPPSLVDIQAKGNGEYNRVGHMSNRAVIGNAYQGNLNAHAVGTIITDAAGNGFSGNPCPMYLDVDGQQIKAEVIEDAGSSLAREGEKSAASNQDILLSKGVHGIPNHAFADQGVSPQKDLKHVNLNDHFGTRNLKSSMDHLQEELERMKNENSLQQNEDHSDPNIKGLERELMQLNKANEDLESMFPLFNEFSGSGNALERVLALEIELAESLRAKKKPSIQFQSSFLKHHSDEAAVFQSFRDINELIKDMLEVKGKYATVDTELREMHNRYSQLSLQFAEVEGERQKLMMTLKNIRASRKLTNLNRSSSATTGGHFS